MDDGTRLDLSGRHQTGEFQRNSLNQNVPAPGQKDWMRGKRYVDHRELFDVSGKGGNWDAMSSFIDQTGAVRYMPNVGVSTVDTNKPSQAQVQRIVSDFRQRGNPLVWDIDSKTTGRSIASKEFERPTVDAVMNWLDSVYGIK